RPRGLEAISPSVDMQASAWPSGPRSRWSASRRVRLDIPPIDADEGQRHRDVPDVGIGFIRIPELGGLPLAHELLGAHPEVVLCSLLEKSPALLVTDLPDSRCPFTCLCDHGDCLRHSLANRHPYCRMPARRPRRSSRATPRGK